MKTRKLRTAKLLNQSLKSPPKHQFQTLHPYLYWQLRQKKYRRLGGRKSYERSRNGRNNQIKILPIWIRNRVKSCSTSKNIVLTSSLARNGSLRNNIKSG